MEANSERSSQCATQASIRSKSDILRRAAVVHNLLVWRHLAEPILAAYYTTAAL